MMTIQDAVRLVIEASEKGKGGEIFILDMGEPVNIKDLALDILKKAGKKQEIKIIGMRPGETIGEKLWLEEEKPKKIGKFYVIR
jgi:FlaA1/EpsC-like NDP-sugar epimerase